MSDMRLALGFCAVLVLASCSDTPKNANVASPVAEVSAEMQIDALTAEPELAPPPTVEPPPRRGLFGVFGRKKDPALTLDIDGSIAEPTLGPDTPMVIEIQPEVVLIDDPATPFPGEAPVAATAVVPEVEPIVPAKPRLLGFLRRNSADDVPALAAPITTVDLPDDDGQTSDVVTPVAAATVAPELPEATPERGLRGPRWLGGGRRAAPRALQQPDFDRPIGTLPFGEIVPNCAVKKRDLGTQVDKAQGGAKFTLYDTDPSSTTPRTQYLIGFRDGCARQFTASLALFGSPVVHEATRYNPNNSAPYSLTDTAYEKIKRRICGVGRGKFCPQSKINKLGREAAFVSLYQGYGSSGAWVEVLLHKGELVTYQTRNN